MIKDRKQLSIVILTSVLIALFTNLPILWFTILQGLEDHLHNKRLFFVGYNVLGNFLIAMFLFHFNLAWKYTKVPWLNRILKQWFVVILINLLITIVLGFLLKEIGLLPSPRRMHFLAKYGPIVNVSSIVLIVILVSRLLELLIKNQQVAIENERLKSESLQNQYNALKSQLDPHFLFNSLNTVMELIEEDKQLAKGFVAKLSDVFRYLLNHSDKKLIPLEQEVQFSEDYLYLLKLRHSQLSVIFNLASDQINWYVPPLALQLLLENAIKHNEISKQKPLEISVVQIGDLLEISNHINKKITGNFGIHGAGMGLKNLMERYRIIADEGINISQEDGVFKVVIPLINQTEKA